MIKYQILIKEDEITQYKSLILEHKLHFAKGESGIKEVVRNNHPIYALVIAYETKPIGCAIVTDWRIYTYRNGTRYDLMCYVKKEFRKQGVGKQLINSILDSGLFSKEELHIWGNSKFFRKCGL